MQDNLRVVRRGFDEIIEIKDKPFSTGQLVPHKTPKLPIMLKQLPEGDGFHVPGLKQSCAKAQLDQAGAAVELLARFLGRVDCRDDGELGIAFVGSR